MNRNFEELWASLPEKADHPYRVAIIEALWRIGEPLSAIGLVDVLDGYMSMWSALAHLHALERLGVVEVAAHEDAPQAYEERFDATYRLINQEASEDG